MIVDGHNLLFQMFFGMPARIFNKDGQPIWGVIGFTGALLKMIKMTSPNKVVVLFDGEHQNDRKEVDADYKSNRIDYSLVEEAENPFSQLKYIYSVLDFLKIKHAEILDGETDDAIASYAIEYGNGNQIVIASFDSDYFQLINENVNVLRYRGDNSTLCDEAYVLNKFGVSPKLYADLKCLVGDKADNVKGIDKIGVKTAALLLNEYGSLDGVLQNCSLIKKKLVGKSLQENKQRAILNKELIYLTKRSKIPFKLDEINFKDEGFSTNQILKAIGVL